MTSYSVPKYFHELFSSASPWLSGAPTILHPGEAHREILSLENCFAKDLNQSSTQASSQGRWKIMIAIKMVYILLQIKTHWRSPLQWNLDLYLYKISPNSFWLHNTPIPFEKIPGVNLKPQIFETVWYGLWEFQICLIVWIIWASTDFSWSCLLDFLELSH